MKNYLIIMCLFLLCAPAFAGQSALAQAQTAAQKGGVAVASTSANKSKGSASDAFRDNGTDACLCKAEGKRAFACDCSNPLAIKGAQSASVKAAKQDAVKGSALKPTDLIDQSSTASHINPDEWQERNPQHIEKNNPFDVLKEKKDTSAESKEKLFDDILSGLPPASSAQAVAGVDFADSSSAENGAGEEVFSSYDNEENLLKQAAANKAAAREDREKQQASAADKSDVLGAAFIELTTAAAAGSLDAADAVSAIAGGTGGASSGGLTREACNSDRATCMKCCAVECPHSHCAYHANSKWRDSNGMIMRCGCE